MSIVVLSMFAEDHEAGSQSYDNKVDRVSKEAVLKASKMLKLEEMIQEKRLRWFGHL